MSNSCRASVCWRAVCGEVCLRCYSTGILRFVHVIPREVTLSHWRHFSVGLPLFLFPMTPFGRLGIGSHLTGRERGAAVAVRQQRQTWAGVRGPYGRRSFPPWRSLPSQSMERGIVVLLRTRPSSRSFTDSSTPCFAGRFSEFNGNGINEREPP